MTTDVNTQEISDAHSKRITAQIAAEKYRTLATSPELQAEAIAEHYSKLSAIAVYLHTLVVKRRIGGSPEMDRCIERLTKEFVDRHLEDLGIELSWQNTEVRQPETQVGSDDLLVSLRSWMPICGECRCRLATHAQVWSDRGPIYYCDQDKCDKSAQQRHDGDSWADQTGLVREEVQWAETVRLIEAKTERKTLEAAAKRSPDGMGCC